MASAPQAGDLPRVAIAVWFGVGCVLGAVAYAAAREWVPLGLAGALVAGSLGGVFGATAESVLEGSSRFQLDPASVAGAVCGALLLLFLLARAGGGSAHRWRDVR
jgi:hypothetical protein